MVAFSLFPTPLGPCGIAWGDHGIRAVQLPGADESRTTARLLRLAPGARRARAPEGIQRVIDEIQELLRGEPRDLRQAALDMRDWSDFQRQVYAIARAIEPRHTRTYGEVAALCGDSGAARAVGQALGCNPCPIIVPCHRVLAAGGRSGGFSAPGGVATKLRLLRLEGWTGMPNRVESATTPANLSLPFL
jgi:methylated-DNA-[protein]-cysteine S-methyltransferase